MEESIAFFNLPLTFSMFDLENAKKNKISEIKRYNLKTEYENLLLSNVEKNYKNLKHHTYNNIIRNKIPQIQIKPFVPAIPAIPAIPTMSNVLKSRIYSNNQTQYGISNNSIMKTLNDGSLLVIDKKTINENGNIKEQRNAYIKYNNGKVINIDYNKALQLK